MPPQESPRPKNGERQEHRRSHTRDPANRRSRARDSAYSSSQALSADALASLNRLNDRTDTEPDTPVKSKARRERRRETTEDGVERRAARQQRRRDTADEASPARRQRRRDTTDEDSPARRQRRRDTADEASPVRYQRRRRTEEDVFGKTTARNHNRRDTGDGYQTGDDTFEEKAASHQHRSRDKKGDALLEKDRARSYRRRDTEEDVYVEKVVIRGHRKKNTEEAVLLDKSSPKRQRKRDAEVDILLNKDDIGRNKVKRRIVSGALLEEGNGKGLKGIRGGLGSLILEKRYSDDSSSDKRYGEGNKLVGNKKLWIAIGVIVLLLIIIIPVAIVASKKKSTSSSSSSSPSSPSSTATPNNSNLNGMSESDIPIAAQGTYLDPFTWYDTSDFNVTYTNETIGGLPIMGLNTSYDNSKSANSDIPTISKSWGDYSTTPARGVNLGGWLSLEPFITPSLFDYSSSLGIIDEWTLTSHLGSAAKSTLEKHYATFITEQDFIDIAAAGLDHVRIQYSYWAVAVYDDDPYVFRTSWRYLLRGIEWARKHGLRVNLDLHGIPGSQNGWNHSGRQGPIGWLNGTNGDLNAQRALDIHNQLSKFFAQSRYKNLITFYGLVNEPKMISLDTAAVVNWTENAYKIVKDNGYEGQLVFGDGFLGLGKWQGLMTGYSDMILDVHQYLIFNVANIPYNHTYKVTYACTIWESEQVASLDVSTGYGPTMNGEWSLSDTDCAPWLNNVNVGARWTGDYNTGDSNTQVLSAVCPTSSEGTCECTDANAAVSDYSTEYKKFLQMFAEAQMKSFETGYGWFYWTWKTESAPQWSYIDALAGGFMPTNARKPEFNCTATVPDYSSLGLAENY